MSKLFSNNKSSWYAALKNLFYLYKTFFFDGKNLLGLLKSQNVVVFSFQVRRTENPRDRKRQSLEFRHSSRRHPHRLRPGLLTLHDLFGDIFP